MVVPEELNGTVCRAEEGFAVINVSVGENTSMLGYLHESEMRHEGVFRSDLGPMFYKRS